MAETTLYAPFDASVAGVQALIPEAKLPVTLAPGVRGVTVAQAEAWVADFSGRVALRLTGYDLLPEPQLSRVRQAARDLVHNATASYVEAARFPERALDGYAALLWSRYAEGLSSLEAWLRPDPGGGGDGGLSSLAGTPAFSFPLPLFHLDVRY